MLTNPMQACLSREVPTDHEAHGPRSNGCRRARAQLQSSAAQLQSSAQESRQLSIGGMYTRRPKQNSRNTSCSCLGWPPEQENDVDAKPEHLSSNVTPLHAQRGKGENSGVGQSSRPHAAREGACAGRRGRTVRNQAAHRVPRERRAGRDRQTDKQTDGQTDRQTDENVKQPTTAPTSICV